MIAQSVFLRTTFRRWLTAMTVAGLIAVVPAAAAQSQRQMDPKNGSSSEPPLTTAAEISATGDDGEQNVHFLTGFRFPPPALFFAYPDRKWTLGDFENSDRPTNQYSVTDDNDDEGPVQQYEKTVQKPDEKLLHQQKDGNRSKNILPTTAAPSEEIGGATTTPDDAEVGETKTRQTVVNATVVGTY